MSELTQQEQEFFASGGEVSPEPDAQPQEPAAEAPVAEPETPAEPAPAAEPAEPKMVPLAALHEARQQAKEAKQALAQMQAQQRLVEQRIAELNARIAPQQQPQVPAFEENPAEHLRTKVQQQEQTLAQMRAQQEAAANEQRFVTWYQTQAARFAQTTPDFTQAYNTFLTNRQSELADQGLAPQQIAAQLRQEEQLLAVTAARMNVNPAQLVYQAAIAKGYKPATQKPAEAPAISAEQKLAAVADGIKSSKSLSQVPGKVTPQLTAEYVANMPKSEWDKFNANWEENMARLAG